MLDQMKRESLNSLWAQSVALHPPPDVITEELSRASAMFDNEAKSIASRIPGSPEASENELTEYRARLSATIALTLAHNYQRVAHPLGLTRDIDSDTRSGKLSLKLDDNGFLMQLVGDTVHKMELLIEIGNESHAATSQEGDVGTTTCEFGVLVDSQLSGFREIHEKWKEALSSDIEQRLVSKEIDARQYKLFKEELNERFDWIRLEDFYFRLSLGLADATLVNLHMDHDIKLHTDSSICSEVSEKDDPAFTVMMTLTGHHNTGWVRGNSDSWVNLEQPYKCQVHIGTRCAAVAPVSKGFDGAKLSIEADRTA